MTGGMVSARLTDLPGSSAVVKWWIVAYDLELKHRLLGLTDITEVVTTDAAVAMARGARALSTSMSRPR